MNEPTPTQAQGAQNASIEGDGTKMQLYVRSMGKLLAVTALFDSDDKANAYMENHKDEGCVATGGGLTFLANLYDHGTRAELPITNEKTKLYVAETKAQLATVSLQANEIVRRYNACQVSEGETPRTDAYFVDNERGVPPANWEMADFARQIERELAQAYSAAQKLAEALLAYVNIEEDAAPYSSSPTRNNARAALRAWEEANKP